MSGNVYDPMIVEAARRHGVPAELLRAIAQTESGFNPRAVGPPTKYGRAQGMFQFIPPTARGMGLADPYDPAASADAAARMLKQSYNHLGDWGLAAAAHNAGAGNIRKWGPDRNRWAPETRNYLGKIERLIGGAAPGSAGQGQGGILGAPAFGAPTVAPSAGDGSQEDGGMAAPAGGGNNSSDYMNMGALTAGLNILANNNGASPAQLMGTGIAGFVNGYGGAVNAQRQANHQALEDQLLTMKLAQEARAVQAAQRQEEALQGLNWGAMTPEERLGWQIDPIGMLKARSERGGMEALQKALAVEELRRKMSAEDEKRASFNAYLETLPESERVEAKALGVDLHARKQIEAQTRREEAQAKAADKATVEAAKEEAKRAAIRGDIETSLGLVQQVRDAQKGSYFTGPADLWKYNKLLNSLESNIIGAVRANDRERTGSGGGAFTDKDAEQAAARFGAISAWNDSLTNQTLDNYVDFLMKQAKRAGLDLGQNNSSGAGANDDIVRPRGKMTKVGDL